MDGLIGLWMGSVNGGGREEQVRYIYELHGRLFILMYLLIYVSYLLKHNNKPINQLIILILQIVNYCDEMTAKMRTDGVSNNKMTRP